MISQQSDLNEIYLFYKGLREKSPLFFAPLKFGDGFNGASR